MSRASNRVETTSRLAQWRIQNLGHWTYCKSQAFKMGKWNWHLAVEKNRVLLVKLYPEISNFTRDDTPIASFNIRVVCFTRGDRQAFIHPEIMNKKLKNPQDFVWKIEVPLTGKLLIDVEFLDLKIEPRDGGEPYSIWAEGSWQNQSDAAALFSLGRTLSENIQADIIINTSDGSIGAHRAVLTARSPVFQRMLSHNVKENKQPEVHIPDMSIETCRAFLNYIYGNIDHEDFLTHRLPLIRAANKYEISDLKEACQESLLEDIDEENVFERLQNAYLYKLPKLKERCLSYLVKFGKIFDVQDDFGLFMRCAERELIGEIFNEVLAAWKSF